MFTRKCSEGRNRINNIEVVQVWMGVCWVSEIKGIRGNIVEEKDERYIFDKKRG